MNRRQWKKACKKAAAECERRWPGEYNFEPAEGDETVSPPHGYEHPKPKPPAGLARRLWRVEFSYTSPPRGTPLIVCHDNYSGEVDYTTALDALQHRELIESTDWEEFGRRFDERLAANHQESVT